MSHLRLIGHSLWITVAVCLLALALAFTATRVLLSFAADYRADVEQRVSEQLGVTVKIGALRGAMRGFRPELRLLDVRVVKADGQDEPLHMREIRLGIDVSRLLSSDALLPNHVSLLGARLLIERHVDGHISVAGVRTPEARGHEQDASHNLALLLGEGAFEIVDSDIMWWDHARDHRPISLSNTYIRIQNSQLDHRIAIRSQLPAGMGNSFELRLHLQGNVMAGSGWDGRAWFKGQDVNVAAIADRFPTGKWQVDQGVASVQLWSTWAQSKLVSVGGQATFDRPHIQHADGQHELTLAAIGAGFAWQVSEQGWRLQVSDLALTTDDADDISQINGRFSLGVQRPESGNPEWVFVSDALQLDAIAHLALQSGLLPEDKQQLLWQTQPRGTLSALQLFWEQSAADPSWKVCAEVDGLHANASQSWPGTRQLSGRLCASPRQGWLSLDSQAAEFELPKLFRDPLPLKRIHGDLRWSRQPEHWLLSSDAMVLDSPDIQTDSRLTLKFPHAGGKPWMDIQTDFKDAEATRVSHYLPAGIMGSKTVAWLDQAFLAGQVPEGRFLYRGEASDFPFRDAPGVFQVLFEAKGVTLSPATGWPQLVGVDGMVEFKNEGLTITGSQGEISGNQIKLAIVKIPDLKYSKHIQVQGEVEDDVAGLYRFFRQSPLSRVVGGLLTASEIQGAGRIWLDMDIPLRSGVEPKVAARAVVRDGVMKFPDWQLTISGVSGDFRFDEQGLQASSIAGEWLGKPLKTDIRSDSKQTRVTTTGRWPVNDLAKAYPSPPWKWVKGGAEATLTVQVPKSVLGGRGQLALDLKSSLKGLSVDLPAPLEKSGSQVVPLNVQLTLGEHETLPLRWSYGKRLQGLLEFKSQAKSSSYVLDRADIHFGNTPASRPTRTGIRVSGQMDTLDVDQWLQLQEQSAAKGPQSTLTINQLDLEVDTLTWSGHSFTDIAFKGMREGTDWVGQMTGPLIQGRIRLPEQPVNQHPISLDLEHLHWPGGDASDGEDMDDPASTEPMDIDPQTIPPVQLVSDRFVLAGAELGRLAFKTQKIEGGLSLQVMEIESKRDHLQATGAWTHRRGQSRTHIKGTLRSEAMGSLLADLGLTDQLKQAKTDVQYNLNWRAAPHAYDNALLNGNLRLKTGKGRLLELEPGVGRVFGLLSLGTIQRRLQLDFSDLLQKGMSFDKIKGSYRIREGQATTDDFSLEGPAAKLDISGRIGLGDRDYDQLVTVTPKTTASLPVAGAIAGGPVVGAAVFLAQKLLGKDVDEITRFQYQVTGTWDEPDIQQISAPGQSFMDKVFEPPAVEEPESLP